MAQEIEIEYKTRLKAEDFYVLKNALAFEDYPIHQINHYFETENRDFEKASCALRIREIDGQYTLTLKQPLEVGLLETNEVVSKETAEKWMNNEAIATAEISEILKGLDIKLADIKYYGQLKTVRYTFKKDDLEYVLDHSFYLDKEDYELEIEASTAEKGESAFENLIEKFNLTQERPVSKVERFMNTLRKTKAKSI